MGEVDLHCHTTASDGMLSPEALVTRAGRLGLRVIAITDHDSVEGIPAGIAAGPNAGLEVIPGIEINTDVPGAEVHILGYYLDHTYPELLDATVRLRDGRIGRARRMAAALTDMGAPVDFHRILEIAGEGAVGRPHVARALVEAGHVNSVSEAFSRYIGRGSPAYVERTKFTPEEACALIRRAGGVPVFAHPVYFDRDGAISSAVDLNAALPALMAAGLMGIEAYYPRYDAVTVEYVLAIARQHGLLVTGGTDFHGGRSGEPEPGSIFVPLKAATRLRQAWEQSRV